MQTRTYGELFKVTSALIGTGGQLAVGEQDQLRHFINRRFQQAFDESPIWPRYLVTSEERNINSHVLSGASASTSTSVNQNYKLVGSNDGNVGKLGTNIYQGVTTSTVIIYKNSSDAWVVETGAAVAIQSDGNYRVTAGTTQFTEADTNKKELIEQVEVWTPRAGSDVLSVIVKNLIPYTETNKNAVGDFNRIHRKKAFLNDSAIEYEFFVDFDGANILNVKNIKDSSAFVSYKKQFTPYTITSGYYDSSLEVPAEFFNFLAHAVYSDFLRVQNRQQEAIAEEQIAQTYLALELEKVDIKNNNNTINKRFSTYVNRQSR